MRITNIKKQLGYIKHWSHFSMSYMFFNLLLTQKDLLLKMDFLNVVKWATSKKTQYIHNYIKTNFGDTLELYRKKKDESRRVSDYKIWVFWAQGFENAPDIVKICNIQLNKNNENVINLSMDNIRNYVDIPQYIIDKLNNNVISITHFSDILRMSLLAKHGGLWIDSTCFTSNNLSTHIAKYKLFSCKSYPLENNYDNLSNSRWSGWAMGIDTVDNNMYALMRDLLYSYWNKEHLLIDFFFIDYLLDYSYLNYHNVRTLLDNIECNNHQWLELSRCRNDKFNREKYDVLIEDNFIFKMSYKYPLRRYTEYNELTFYGKLYQDVLQSNAD